MTSRVTGASFDARPASVTTRATVRPRPRRRYSALQRAIFVIALVSFTLASTYSSLVLLARVTPALFPGKSLTAIPGLSTVGGSIGIDDGGEGSVFNKRINLLVLGLDKRPYEPFEGAYRTDVVMITTVDPVTGKASGLSIPRDVVFGIYDEECNRLGEDRINTAYPRGWNEGQNFHSAAEEVKRTLWCELQIEIDHHVIMDFEGVRTLIDALGGVDIDIPYDLAVYDWWYSDENTWPEYVTFPPGPYHFDGYYGVAFGRYRDGGNGDFDRVKRQQLVLQAALSKALQLGWVDSPGQIKRLWDAYNATVKTDIQPSEAAGYGLLLKGTGGQITMHSIADPNPLDHTPTLTDYIGPGGAALQRYDLENVKFWLDQVFTKAEYADADVEVQNARGPGESGVNWTGAVARYLLARGLPDKGAYLGEDVPVQAETQIVLHDLDRRGMAEDIADWLGLPLSSIIEEPSDPSDVTHPDIVVIVGTEFELPG